MLRAAGVRCRRLCPFERIAQAIGSLVLGVYEGDTLRHIGRVGTGFSGAVATDLMKKLSPMHIRSSPFGERLSAEERRDVIYVQPELVAEVEFRGWTADGHLRHASFRGLREDNRLARSSTRVPGPPP